MPSPTPPSPTSTARQAKSRLSLRPLSRVRPPSLLSFSQVYVNFNDDFATAKLPSTEPIPESPRITPLSVKALGIALRRGSHAGHAETSGQEAAATAGDDAPVVVPSIPGLLSVSLNVDDGKSDSDSRRGSISTLPRTLTAPVSLEDAKQLWARWSLPSFVARSLQDATALDEGGPQSASASRAGRRASDFAGSPSLLTRAVTSYVSVAEAMSSRPSSKPPSLPPSKPPSRSITASGPLEAQSPKAEAGGSGSS